MDMEPIMERRKLLQALDAANKASQKATAENEQLKMKLIEINETFEKSKRLTQYVDIIEATLGSKKNLVYPGQNPINNQEIQRDPDVEKVNGILQELQLLPKLQVYEEAMEKMTALKEINQKLSQDNEMLKAQIQKLKLQQDKTEQAEVVSNSDIQKLRIREEQLNCKERELDEKYDKLEEKRAMLTSTQKYLDELRTLIKENEELLRDRKVEGEKEIRKKEEELEKTMTDLRNQERELSNFKLEQDKLNEKLQKQQQILQVWKSQNLRDKKHFYQSLEQFKRLITQLMSEFSCEFDYGAKDPLRPEYDLGNGNGSSGNSGSSNSNNGKGHYNNSRYSLRTRTK